MSARIDDADGLHLDRLGRSLWRWTQVLVLGLAIDVAVGGGIDGGGVLPTLAVVGVVVTALGVAGVRTPWAWAAVAVLSAWFVVPLTSGRVDGFGEELVGGPFALPVYLVFAAGGAAVASAAPAGERALPLRRAVALTMTAGVVAALLDAGRFAPAGLWPPSRYPGDLSYTVWGLAASLLLWAAVRRCCSSGTALGRALARAGQRTLLVFGLHYLLKLGLQHTGLLGTLDTRAWGWAAWGGVALACWLSARPLRAERTASAPVTAGTLDPR